MTQILAWGQVTDLTLSTLKEIGANTARTLADWADLPFLSVHRALQRMSNEPRRHRRVHIVRWTYEGSDLEKPCLRAVYACGPGLNADRPPPRAYNDVRRESAQRAQAMFSASHLGIKQKTAKKLRAQLNRGTA